MKEKGRLTRRDGKLIFSSAFVTILIVASGLKRLTAPNCYLLFLVESMPSLKLQLIMAKYVGQRLTRTQRVFILRLYRRRASSKLGISRASIQRMLFGLHVRSYRPRSVQQLNDDDSDQTIEFCQKTSNNHRRR